MTAHPIDALDAKIAAARAAAEIRAPTQVETTEALADPERVFPYVLIIAMQSLIIFGMLLIG